ASILYPSQIRPSPPCAPGDRPGDMEQSPLPPPKAAAPQEGDSLAGFLYALSAYLLWGFLPLYMKALDHVSPVEVVAHRVIWALPVALLILALTRRTAELRAALRNPGMLGM